jgi:hypothetical protein
VAPLNGLAWLASGFDAGRPCLRMKDRFRNMAMANDAMTMPPANLSIFRADR